MEYFAIHIPKKTEEETETGNHNFFTQYLAIVNRDVDFFYRTILYRMLYL